MGLFWVIAIGFEPMTVCLEGRCSIQLSYATSYAERLGFEPRQRLHVDRLAICSITTLAPLQNNLQQCTFIRSWEF